MRVLSKHKYLVGTILTIVSIAFAIAACLHILYANNTDLHGGKTVVIIEKGMNVHAIADILKERGVLSNSRYFIYAAKLLRLSNQLKAGRYQFENEKNNYQILKILREGRVSSIKVTIPEGLQTKQIVSLLRQNLSIDSVKMITLVRDTNFVKSLNVPAKSLDGFLFPETYFFFWQQNEETILKRMVQHFFSIIDDSLQARMKRFHFTLLETVTMASLIQGEAMKIEEMPTISAVYHNRLQRKMLLQADPTLQFIIPDSPRRLLNADKKIDSPYNTYLYPGLPPGPVNNPGRDALLAALNPENVPYLYFVAKGDGTHHFSNTLEEHLKAKRQFDRVRKTYYRKLKTGGDN